MQLVTMTTNHHWHCPNTHTAQCKQMVIEGHLPVTVDEAIFMAALQTHIEVRSKFNSQCSLKSVSSLSILPLHPHLQDLADPFSHLAPPTISSTLTRNKKRHSLRLKSALPPSYSRIKNISKRIKVQMEEFESCSERNSKHLYIGRCQTNPGYDCSFFSVKVPSGSRFKKNGIQKQLLGINSKRVIFLDEKSKVGMGLYMLADWLPLKSLCWDIDPPDRGLFILFQWNPFNLTPWPLY